MGLTLSSKYCMISPAPMRDKGYKNFGTSEKKSILIPVQWNKMSNVSRVSKKMVWLKDSPCIRVSLYCISVISDLGSLECTMALTGWHQSYFVPVPTFSFLSV